jgi:hypothetical protein
MEDGPEFRSLEMRVEDWRDRVLPLMSYVLVGLILVFVGFSFYELRDFYSRIEHAPLDLGGDFAAFEAEAGDEIAGDLDYLRFKTQVRLEADALQRRYHQATTTMLARVWTRQLGFLTGMILALVGAAFVLGRLQDGGTKVSGQGGGVTGAIDTASPGLVLAALGAGLMAITLVMPFGVETFDRPIYVDGADEPAAAATETSAVTAAPGPASDIAVMPPDPGDPPPRQP